MLDGLAYTHTPKYGASSKKTGVKDTAAEIDRKLAEIRARKQVLGISGK